MELYTFRVFSAVIEQWGFFNVAHILWQRASIYNVYLRGPVKHTPVAERLVVELSLLVLTTLVCRGWNSNFTTFRMRGERSNRLRHRASLCVFKPFSYQIHNLNNLWIKYLSMNNLSKWMHWLNKYDNWITPFLIGGHTRFNEQ